MKKQKISFETNFWIRYEAGSPRKVIDAFFENDNLASYKQMLGEVLMYTRKREVYQREYPGTVFIFIKRCVLCSKPVKACSLKAGKFILQRHPAVGRSITRPR